MRKTLLGLFLLVPLLLLSGSPAHYRKHGRVLLPDLRVTPGAVRTTDRDKICNESTAQYRHTTPAMKSKVYELYGATKKAGVCCEVDHLVPLELGGADEIKNLWPQPYEPRPAAHEKDKLENYLHRQVCAGQMAPAEAQKQIAGDWYKAYLAMLAAK